MIVMNKWLRRLWLVNGIIFLIGSSLLLLQFILSYFQFKPVERGPIVGEKMEKALSDSLILQDISMTLPRSIGISHYQFIQLISRDLTEPVRISSERSPKAISIVPYDYAHEYNALIQSGTINLLFLKADGSDPHLLLDRKAFIATADIPRESDSLQTVNIYRIVFEDTDNDGRLTLLDRSSLWYSDLDGRHLCMIINDSLRVVRYSKLLRDNKIYIQVKIEPVDKSRPEIDWPERIYVFDTLSHELSPLISETEILDRVWKQLWSK
jgi:hypothetical protein